MAADRRTTRIAAIDRVPDQHFLFALAVAVIFDAFVVRMLIIPAVMAQLAQDAPTGPEAADGDDAAE